MTPCTCHPGNDCASAASCAAARRVEFGDDMTTPQPAALPDLTAVIKWLENGCDPREAVKELKHYQSKLQALAALQSQPAAAGVSDRVVKALLAQALFFKEGAHTVASLEADIRAILALRPQATPAPVAWMWKFEGEDGAAFSSKEPTISIRDGVNYVPLYTHPAPGVPEVWDEGYKQGVEDERTSEANIGVAGFGAKVAPARQNPYRAAQAKGGE